MSSFKGVKVMFGGMVLPLDVSSPDMSLNKGKFSFAHGVHNVHNNVVMSSCESSLTQCNLTAIQAMQCAVFVLTEVTFI